MKRFVIGWYSLPDNELELYEVRGKDELSTAVTFVYNKGWGIEESEIESLKYLQNLVFNGDCMINVIEIDAEPEKQIAALLKP